MPRLTTEQCRVLEMLAGTTLTEAALSALGCSIDTLADLVRTGLASMTLEHMLAGDKTIEVVRVKITEAGRLAILSRSSVT
jgi:hypothetical protein